MEPRVKLVLLVYKPRSWDRHPRPQICNPCGKPGAGFANCVHRFANLFFSSEMEE